MSVDARGIRTFQSSPEQAEFFRRFEDARGLPAVSHTIDFLMKASASRSPNRGVFAYAEDGRSSGYMRLEGYTAAELQRVDDWFRVEEIGHALGYAKPPKQPLDRLGRSAVHTPVLPIVYGSVFIVVLLVVLVLSLAGLLPQLGGIWIAALCLLPLMVLLVVLGAVRLRWWVRAREYVRSRGERMPYGLGAAD
jgi:hypothetical protein